ncbi:ArnT family glycosyltransferase [Gordonia sp. (in: high G+C Gram-positive bacteria)]|uniref:ArnT family glycosyltransferase n=1 Tax=Gordonia sp. (in: high G+C Gram-positive bacteria) TaxID=84139 RepID=UPI003527439B
MSTTIAPPAPPAEPPAAAEPAGSAAPQSSPRTLLVERLSLGALLVGTLIAYLWNLSANGWANSFYTAAIQAGSKSWKAWFFGSSDMANSITVDKPPASLWIPGLSVRVFGLNSWSVLVPQVLMGVATVWLLYVIVKRYFGHWAGIGAGLVLALTPVAALMFRFNNPEALLLLLLTASVWAIMRAIDTGKWKWLIWSGVAVGFAFLTKQFAAFLVLPALVIAFFAFAPGTWLRRVGQLFAALGALIVSAGWWILTVELWPAGSRPWIGGSQHNSILELTFGYNGFGRLDGNERGSVVPGGGHGGSYGAGGMFGGTGAEGFPGGGFPGGRRGGGMWGQAGFWRMFQPEQGGQIAWLIPTALIFAVAALVLIGRAPRTDRRRAFIVLSAIWMLTTMVVFSYMQGIFHSYYTAAIAPALAGLVAASAAVCWGQRDKLWVRLVLAAGAATAAIWGYVLLNRAPDFVPWLRWVVLMVGVLAAVALIVVRKGVAGYAVAAAAIVAALAGPAAYTFDTIGTPAEGSIISAGPRVAGGFGPGGGHMPGMRGGMPGGRGGFGGGNGMPNGFPGGAGMPGMPGGTGQHGTTMPGFGTGHQSGSRRGGGGGGLLMGSKPSEQVIATLRTDADRFTWVAAAVGSNEASGYQIESGYSVMPIGGFNGTDPSPTLAQFQKYVEQHKIHYFIGGNSEFGEGFGGGARGGRSGTSSEIREWVEANFTPTTVDGVTLYDLTAPKK